MNIEQKRAAFEAWCKERFGQIPLWVEEDGEYVLSSVQLRFEAYQAALASPEVQDEEVDAIRAAQTLGTAIYETAQRMGIANSDHSNLSVPQLLHLLDCMAKPVDPVTPDADPVAVCVICGGSGMVDDGEIDCYENGEPYLNGPVKCVKDCPACTPQPQQIPEGYKLVPAESTRLTPDEARWAARTAELMNGPSDTTSPTQYAMAGAQALAAKIEAAPEPKEQK